MEDAGVSSGTGGASGVGAGATGPAPGAPSGPNSPFTIFDRNAKKQQRSRAAQRRGGEASRQTDYLREAVAENLCERLYDIKRDFETIVDLGSGAGFIARHLDAERTGTKRIIMCDSSEAVLHRDDDVGDKSSPPGVQLESRVVDEESLPFEENSLDCVVCCGSLHWTNDLPGALVQIQRALKPDGVFIGAVCGGDTLFELRTSLQLAEQEREGGISPRVSPMADSRDMVSLLSRAGFNIPTVDTDEIEVGFPSMYELMSDLRDMGESNAVIHRRPVLQRDTALAAGAIYKLLHGSEDDTVPATFSIIYMVGWKPDPSQRKPLKRGQISHNMKDVLGEEGGGSDGNTQGQEDGPQETGRGRQA